MEPNTFITAENQFLDQHSKKALNLARRTGYAIVAKPKLNAGTNRQNIGTKWSFYYNDNGDEINKIKQMTRDTRQIIRNGRQEKGWTQKDLAQKINEKQNLIKNFEAGNVILSDKILIKLRGKDRGQYILPKLKVLQT